MTDAAEDNVDDSIQVKKARLEQLGYRTAHLSSSQIDELTRCIEMEQPAAAWRSKL